VIRIERHESGPRLHIWGFGRVHHFHTGILAIAIGLYLVAVDFRDFLARMRQLRGR
jgi:hypothetical protein